MAKIENISSKWKSESLYSSDNWSESVVCCSFPLSPPRLVIYERRRDLILATTSSVNKGLVFILSPYSSRPFITRVILLLASSLTDPHIFVSRKKNIFVLKKTYSRPLEKKSHGWNFFCDSYQTDTHCASLIMYCRKRSKRLFLFFKGCFILTCSHPGARMKSSI